MKAGIRGLGTAVAAGALLAALAPSALAGGFYLSVKLPDASARVKGAPAVLLVQAGGCVNPRDVRLVVSAEGILDGERRTVHVPVQRLSNTTWAVRRAWPSRGAWVLLVTAGHPAGIDRSVLIDLDASGQLGRRRTHPDDRRDNPDGLALARFDRCPTEAQVGAALARLAAGRRLEVGAAR